MTTWPVVRQAHFYIPFLIKLTPDGHRHTDAWQVLACLKNSIRHAFQAVGNHCVCSLRIPEKSLTLFSYLSTALIRSYV